MPFTENLRAFTATADFGSTGVWTPVGGGTTVSVNGIFDTDRAAASLLHRDDFNVNLGMEGSGPSFGCPIADLTGFDIDGPRGESFLLDETTATLYGVPRDYVIKSASNDGTGWVVLVLELAP